MGAPTKTKGASATLPRHTGSGGLPVDGGQDKRAAGKQVAGKLQRTRRNRRRVKEHPCPKQHHKQHHRLLAPVPASPFNESATCRRGDSLCQRTLPFPSLIRHSSRPHDDSGMLRTRQPLESGPGAPSKGGVHPTSPRSSKTSHEDSTFSESVGGPSPVLTAAGRPHSGNDNNSSSSKNYHVHDQEQEAIRRGLEELLARPPPSFDSVATEDGEGECRQGSLLQRGGGDAASRSLPELFLSRAGDRGNVDNSNPGSKRGHHKERRRGSRSSSSRVASTLTNTKDSRRAKKPTRSQSGGLLRPAPSLTVGSAAAFDQRDSAASAGLDRIQGTTAAASFTRKDALLLEQAFAFAERVATEEGEEETMGRLARLGGEGRRRPVRARRWPAAAGLPFREDRHHRERFTRSSGASEVSGGSGGDVARGSIAGAGRIEVEDWVRGLQGLSSQKRQPTYHQQSERSINQAPSDGSDWASRGREGKKGGKRGTTVTGSRKQQGAEPGALRFDRRRETKESKKMMATAELVERFAAGTGVAELRAELEASQASMKRSAEAIEQVASRWHQQRSPSTL